MSYNVDRFYAKQRREAEKHMGSEEEMIEHVSKSLITGEAALDVMELFYCELAGDDRMGDDAQAQETVRGAGFAIKAQHSVLSVLAAVRRMLKIRREGGR